MKHPYPAEHDQQQAEALDLLKTSESFILVNFTDNGRDECEFPFCEMMHSHRAAKVIASCGSQDLHHAVNAIQEEIVLTTSIEVLMNLDAAQREQIAAMLRHEEGAFFRLRDDEA